MRSPLHFLNISHRHENGKVIKQNPNDARLEVTVYQIEKACRTIYVTLDEFQTVIARMRCMDRTLYICIVFS